MRVCMCVKSISKYVQNAGQNRNTNLANKDSNNSNLHSVQNLLSSRFPPKNP
jgi:hypothetical protein